MFPDVLRLLCEQMPGHLGLPTETDLRDGFTAPMIQLAEIPGGAYRDRPWNGPALTEAYDFDVIVFSPKGVPDDVGVARDRAHEVRDWLELWSHPGVVLTPRRPTRLPDYNPNLIRFGMTVGVIARRDL